MSDNLLSIHSAASDEDDWRNRVNVKPVLTGVAIEAGIWKIALGVFLGNLMFSVLGAIVYALTR